MNPKLVDQAYLFPGECMFLGTYQGPIIDTQIEFVPKHQGRVYVSVKALELLCEAAGFPLKREYERLQFEMENAKTYIEELELQIADLAAFKLQTESMFERAGFQRRRSRTKKETADVS